MTGKHKHCLGFTLVEVLISLVLLSLLSLGMVSAMRTMGQTQDRIDQRFARAEELQSVMGFVDEILGRVSDRRSNLIEQGKPVLLFNGQARSIEWLGIMPARHGMGGRHFFKLAIETVASEQALVLRYQPWRGESSWPDWTSASWRVLVPEVSRLSISYAGKDMLPQQWTPAWALAGALPERIRLDVSTRWGEWPLWLIPVHSLSPGGGRSDMFTTGPR